MNILKRGPLTELDDGTFTCTVALSAENIGEFLTQFPLKAKPPTQRASVKGIDAFATPTSAAEIEQLVQAPPFQSFVESRYPITDGVDSVTHARRVVNQYGSPLLSEYRSLGV